MFLEKYIFKSILTFFILFPLFSFSQDSVKTVSIEYDSIYNPRFTAIANLLFDHLVAGELKVYQNDLDTIANMNYIKERITGEASTIDEMGNETIILTHYDETNVSEYEVARKNNKWFICPNTGAANCIWIGLDDLKGILPDSSIAYMKDLFINEHTKVVCKIVVPGDVNAEFDNSMRSVFYKIRNLLMQGEIKAFDDMDLLIEKPMSEIRSSFFVNDTIQTENMDVNEGWEVRSSEVLPNRFYYLFNGELNKGKLDIDRSNIVALAPVAPCYNQDGFGGYDCRRILFWFRYAELNRLLMNYEKEIIVSNFNKQYSDYVLERYSVHYFSLDRQADSSNISALMIKLVKNVLNGDLSAFHDIEFNEQLTISMANEQMHDSSLLSYKGKFPDQIEKIVPMYNWIGLVKYHYRTDDHHFSTGSFPYALTFGFNNDERPHRSFLMYLPELRGRCTKAEFEMLMNFFEKNGTVKTGVYALDTYGAFILDSLHTQYPTNFPSSEKILEKKYKIEYESLYNTKGKESYLGDIYVNKIFDDEKEIPIVDPDKYYSQHPLIPYNSFAGKKENANQYPLIRIPYKAGYCDEEGVVRIPLRYDYTEFFSEARGLVGNRTNVNEKFPMRFGFVDARGNETIPLIYEDALSFSNGLAAVKLNGKWGYVSKNALTGLPFEFDRAYSFSDERAVVVKDKKFCIINLKGKMQGNVVCDSIFTFHDGLARFLSLGQYGSINKKGKIVIPALFNQVNDIENGIVKCIDGAGQKHFFDHKGKELFLNIENVETASGEIAIKKADGKYILLDKKGKELKKLDYVQITQFSEGLMAVRKGYYWVFIDLAGNEVISNLNGRPIGWTSSFSDSVCLVSYAGTNTVLIMDHKGRLKAALPTVGVGQVPDFENGYIRVNDSRNGYINKSGKEYFYH